MVLEIAKMAANLRLGYPLTFSYLPSLRKPTEPPPTLEGVLTALGAAQAPGPLPVTIHAPAPHNNDADTHPGDVQWHDLAGDATTVNTQTPGRPPQCILASTRNLARRGLLTEQELIRRFCSTPSIYSIDYRRVLEELVCSDTEVALRFPLLGPQAVTLTTDVTKQIESAFCIVQGQNGWQTHVVALIKIQDRTDGPPRYRLYDNDSPARLHGTFTTVTNDFLSQRAQALYITTHRGSLLANTIRGVAGSGRGGTGQGGWGPVTWLC